VRFERGHARQAGDNQKRVGGEILLVIMDFSDLRPSSPRRIFLSDRSFSLHHEVHEGHEERRTELARPSGFKNIFSSFVLFVPFVVGYPAGRIVTDVDTSIARLDPSIAVFRFKPVHQPKNPAIGELRTSTTTPYWRYRAEQLEKERGVPRVPMT
jgi:hypothetical protein